MLGLREKIKAMVKNSDDAADTPAPTKDKDAEKSSADATAVTADDLHTPPPKKKSKSSRFGVGQKVYYNYNNVNLFVDGVIHAIAKSGSTLTVRIVDTERHTGNSLNTPSHPDPPTPHTRTLPAGPPPLAPCDHVHQLWLLHGSLPPI